MTLVLIRKHAVASIFTLPLLVACCGGTVEPAAEIAAANGGSAGGSSAGAGGSYAGSGGTLPEAGPDVIPPEAGPDVFPPETGPDVFPPETGPDVIPPETGPDVIPPETGPDVFPPETGPDVIPPDALVPCPGGGTCSGHGTCDGLTGVCSCAQGYKGDACNTCVKSHWLGQAFTVGVHEPVNLALGDVDGDGLLDLAVSNWNQPTVTIWHGLGTGDFDTKSVLQASGNPSELRLVDFDLDGALDLVVQLDGDKNGMGQVGTWRNSGAGSFGAMQVIEVQQDITSMATGDVNHDDKPDIVVVDLFTNSVLPLHGDGMGSFAPVSPHTITGGSAFNVAIGDLDGDGWDDIAVPAGGKLGVLFNKPGGTGPMLSFASSEWAQSVTIVDLTGDGMPEVATTFSSGNIGYMLNNGGGTFAPGGVYAAGTQGAYNASAGDLDGNGLADLVVPGFWKSGTAVMLNTGSGLVKNAMLDPGGEPRQSAIADLNRDGRLDVVVGNPNVNEVVVYLNECIP